MKKRLPILKIEDAKIIFKNFSGAEKDFNPEGQRNFCLLLDEQLAEQLVADGWNVKYPKQKPDSDTLLPHTKIRVNIDGDRPPKIVLITSRNKKELYGDEIKIIDWADIEKIDLTVAPSHWEMGGKSGVTGYLRSMYVTIVEDELENKYYDIPDASDEY